MTTREYFETIKKRHAILLKEFSLFNNSLTDIDDIEPFCRKYIHFYSKIDRKFAMRNIDELTDIFNFKVKISNLLDFKYFHPTSKRALEQYYLLDTQDEKSIIEWVLKYEDADMVFPSIEKVHQYLFKIEPNSNVIVDCSKYHESYDFPELHVAMWSSLFLKYKPHDRDLYKTAGDTLSDYLKFQNVI